MSLAPSKAVPFFESNCSANMTKKTPAEQLSLVSSLYFAGMRDLVSLIFSRLAIVNPPKAPKFILLFK